MALEPHRRGCAGHGLAPGRGVRDRQPPVADGPRVPIREMELPGHVAFERPVVELERVPQVAHRPVLQHECRVEFLRAVLARVPEGEPAVHLDRRRPARDDRLRDVDVAVLDREAPGRSPPHDVPGAHVVPEELPLDERALERLRHRPAELAVAPDVDHPGLRSEGRQDPRHQAIALLPVGAARIERELGSVAEGRASLEFDVGAFGGQVTRVDLQPLGREAVDELAADRGRHGKQAQVPLGAVLGRERVNRRLFGCGRARQQRPPFRRHDAHAAAATVLRERAERPLEHVVAGGRAQQPQAAHPDGVREQREIDVAVGQVEPSDRRRRGGERRHQVPKRRHAVVEPGRRLRHFETVRLPHERAAKVGKREGVHVRHVAREVTLQLVAAREQAKVASEARLAAAAPRLVREEDLAHPPEVHPRVDVIDHLRPRAPEIHFSRHQRVRAVGVQVDLGKPQQAAVDLELHAHVGPHRLVVLDSNHAVGDRRSPQVLARVVPHVDVEVARLGRPCGVVDVGELPPVGVQELDRRREALRPRRCLRLALQVGHAVALRRLLDLHRPVGHLERTDEELAGVEHLPPGKIDR